MSRGAQAILLSALARSENRGAQFQKHSIFWRDGQVVFEKW
jgi:hypothetical protein